MNVPPLRVLPYTEENLATAFCLTPNTIEGVSESVHFKYFASYFGTADDGLAAGTILIEEEYISKSYLIDYSNFYSNCFTDYKRKCRRVHFFKEQISEKQFKSLLVKPKQKSTFWSSYLGYVVIKPLPGLSIGASIVKTYLYSEDNPRQFPATKLYSVNLFGKKLEFNSLAFQQQDSVVGACATSALWSAFHKTSQLFQTPLPSLSDITKSAKNLFTQSGRTFPNKGLDYYQIGNAIENVGLVSELRNRFDESDASFIKSFIYAYNKIGLPVLLGIGLPGRGDHLVTVVGFNHGAEKITKRKNELALRTDRIYKLYVHDDQIGPFSRMTILPKNKIETGWVEKDGSFIIGNLVSIVVPLHNKIRLTFEDVKSKIQRFDLIMGQIMSNLSFSWDIYLSLSNEYKQELFESPVSVSNSFKLEILTNPLPKYIWVAKGFVGEECVIHLLYDATQIAQADALLEIIILNKSLEKTMEEHLFSSEGVKSLVIILGKHFFELLQSAVREKFAD